MSIERTVVFGAGESGRNFIKNSPVNVVAFVDNNRKLWGQEVEGVEVFAPSRLCELNPTRLIIATARYAEISGQIGLCIGELPVSIEFPPKKLLSIGPLLDDCFRAAVVSLVRTLCVFEDPNRGFTPSWGTLLGLYRDGDLITWDNDLDLFAFGLSAREVESQLRSAARRQNFQVRDFAQHPSGRKFSCYVQRPHGVSLSVTVDALTRKDNYFQIPVDHVASGFMTAGRIEDLLPLRPHDGLDLQLVAKPDILLDVLYGPGWVTPDPGYTFESARKHFLS